MAVPKNAAQNAVEHLTGVKGVTNNITVKSPIAPSAIQGKIEAAIERRAALGAKVGENRRWQSDVRRRGPFMGREEAAGRPGEPRVWPVENNIQII